ncbi:MAG: bifunctional 5,10-methylenetetrahydrofolate dehydrogenase/5,10-methenyltetrahydrofolate cyclohydrolase [Thermoplasmata archaeon]
MSIIDGRKIAQYYEEKLKVKTSQMGRPPSLHTILVGEDEGSKIYIGVKDRGCKRVGIETTTHKFHKDASEKELKEFITKLNKDRAVDGILLQMPLPDHLEPFELISSINITKDVEGMHPYNLGRLTSEDEGIVPCTPGGIITMLDYEGTVLKGKEVCVVSHSTVVGKPMALMLLNRDATVTVVHEYTRGTKDFTKRADVLIAAAGVPGLITKEMIKEGVIIIDVGMNRLENGDIVGDVEFDDLKKRADKITPVPGGVGPMTVLTLLQNTVKLAGNNQKKYK